jgi:hypothetical protein
LRGNYPWSIFSLKMFIDLQSNIKTKHFLEYKKQIRVWS